jgi:energy-coupling factor transporter ATP-binding protein EcfA2
MFVLTEGQQEAYDYIIEYLPKENVILLEGQAGTGKTTLTRSLCAAYRKGGGGQGICAIAPTHKAKKVIQSVLNQDTLIPVAAMTIASALGKIREHSYLGTQHYNNGSNKKMSAYRLFLVDEVSMIHDADLRILVNYIRQTKKQLLLLGDRNQIPCPKTAYQKTEYGYLEKADSYVFRDPSITCITLNEIVRQAEGSPILRLASYIITEQERRSDPSFPQIIESSQFQPWVISFHEVVTTFLRHFDPTYLHSCRILAYTNAAVRCWNLEVRAKLFPGQPPQPFHVGDILTGYCNIEDSDIENGEDSFVTKVTEVYNHTVDTYSLSGYLCDLLVSTHFGGPGGGLQGLQIKNIFFIQIFAAENQAFLLHLIHLAMALNRPKSTRQDYHNYIQVKSKVLFLEDLYFLKGRVYDIDAFRDAHPLLMTHVSEILTSEGAYIESILCSKLQSAYPEVLEARRDDDKSYSSGETFADAYKVIEKDMYYGYAITVHKSQGSTYEAALVDEPDFAKCSNRWNHRFQAMECRTKEKNQIRYVAYTRAKTHLYLMNDSASDSASV